MHKCFRLTFNYVMILHVITVDQAKKLDIKMMFGKDWFYLIWLSGPHTGMIPSANVLYIVPML